MKYRRNKVKREHSIIKDALAWLEEISRHPEIADIIPGSIEVSRSPERGIVYKYKTQTGCKLLLKSNGSIQEAFVVTKNPEWVKDWVEKRFPPSVPGGEETRRAAPESRLNGEARKQGIPQNNAAKLAVKGKKTQPRQKTKTAKRYGNSKDNRAKHYPDEYEGFWTRAGELDPANISEQINPDTRAALHRLRKQLTNKKQKDKGK